MFHSHAPSLFLGASFLPLLSILRSPRLFKIKWLAAVADLQAPLLWDWQPARSNEKCLLLTDERVEQPWSSHCPPVGSQLDASQQERASVFACCAPAWCTTWGLGYTMGLDHWFMDSSVASCKASSTLYSHCQYWCSNSLRSCCCTGVSSGPLCIGSAGPGTEKAEAWRAGASSIQHFSKLI